MKGLIAKIKESIFKKKCPNIKCETCKYFYKDCSYNRRCSLVDKYLH